MPTSITTKMKRKKQNLHTKHSDEDLLEIIGKKQKRRQKKNQNKSNRNNLTNQYDYELYLDNEAEQYIYE